MPENRTEECAECRGIGKIESDICHKCGGSGKVLIHSHPHSHGDSVHDHPHPHDEEHGMDEKTPHEHRHD